MVAGRGFGYAARYRLTDSSTTGNWSYNTTNQLTAYSDTTLVYDDNGSTIKKTKAGVITTFDYNTENRLTAVKDNTNATIATYYYDPFGRRLYKDVSGTRTYFMYAAEGLIAELDSTGTVTQSYAYQPQSTYGTSPLTTKTSTGYAYYQLDHLGTPQQLVNKTGLVVWKAKALAFGESSVEVNTVTNNLRFAGQYYDSETGLHYNYFRDYDPATGRYVQSDPIGLGGGLNTYGYVGGNPLSYSDPLGLEQSYKVQRYWHLIYPAHFNTQKNPFPKKPETITEAAVQYGPYVVGGAAGVLAKPAIQVAKQCKKAVDKIGKKRCAFAILGLFCKDINDKTIDATTESLKALRTNSEIIKNINIENRIRPFITNTK